jgi:hypothetical protein
VERKNLDIMDVRLHIYERDGYKCCHPECGVMDFYSLQMAHRIAKTNFNRFYIRSMIRLHFNVDVRKKTIEKILHHPLNLVTSCSKHNDYFNIGFKRNEAEELIKLIYLNI